MPISIIAALDQNRLIGSNGKLPWHLPADLARFKNITLNKTVIMGRKTFESIGGPLPSRLNIILSRNINLKIPQCEVYHTIPVELFSNPNNEVFIIGGSEIYQTFLPLANKLYLTKIHHSFTGDCYFPELNKDDWQEIEREDFPQNANNLFPFTFTILKRS
jgi:dihydrofolate reductase